MSVRRQLESLLSEPVSEARVRENSAFVQASGTKRSTVIFGFGRLGRIVLHGLRRVEAEPIAFTDNNKEMWGKTIDGLPVLSLERAAKLHARNAVFIITVWHPQQIPLMSRLLDQLENLVCCTVSFPALFWHLPDMFLPYYLWDLPSKLLPHGADLLATFDLLNDEISRQVFVSQGRLLLRADFRGLPAISSEEQYFPDLFRITPHESFVDCGAYNGDTIRALLRASKGRFKKVIAFEADAAVTCRFKVCLDEIGSRAVMRAAAVSNTVGNLCFTGDGIGGDRISEGVGSEVPCVRLDDVLADEQPSFIKMDIEGAELHALSGAWSIVQKHRAVLAICAYHRQDHLWKILMLLHGMLPDAALFMRTHRSDGFDVVCYAVPPERTNRANQSAADHCPNLSPSARL